MNEITTSLWAIPLSGLVLMSPVWISAAIVLVRDRYRRAECRRRHPSSLARVERNAMARRAVLDRRAR